MVLDIKRARPNNKILVNRDLNCNEIIVGNTSKRIFY